ncbi:MAG: hypothetical protein IPI32_00635 [Austwickia sp.]|nr:hypothetical protein [Austwickia sp.]MBK8437466.1 hypothetical protein [Austwickia sp.]MBK9102731.1 hypothetical protein [Austwickia sp.]
MVSLDILVSIFVAMGIVFMGIIAVVPLVIDNRPKARRRAVTPRPPSTAGRQT